MKWEASNHDAHGVADYLIRRGRTMPGGGFTPLAVIMLSYLCHGWMLGLYGHAYYNNLWRRGGKDLWCRTSIIASKSTERRKFGDLSVIRHPDSISLKRIWPTKSCKHTVDFQACSCPHLRISRFLHGIRLGMGKAKIP